MSEEYETPATAAIVSVLGSLLVMSALAVTNIVFSLVAAVGAVIMAVSLFYGSQTGVRVAGGWLLLGILASGIQGGSELPILVATVGLIVAYDASQHGIRLGQQVGASTETRLVGLYHSGTTLLVSSVSAGLVFLVFSRAPSDPPGLAVPIVLFAGIVLLLALSETRMQGDDEA